MLLQPTEQTAAHVVERLAGYLVLEPTDWPSISAAGRWTIDGLTATLPARHANDGPEAAYVILPSGATRAVEVVPSTRVVVASPSPDPGPTDRSIEAQSDPTVLETVPHPVRVEPRSADTSPLPFRSITLATPSSEVAAPWDAVRRLADRLGRAVDRDVGPVLEVDAAIDAAGDQAPDGYRVEFHDGGATVIAGGPSGLRYAFTTLAQLVGDPPPDDGVRPMQTRALSLIDDAPAMAFRGVHLDLARQWYESDVVLRLIDLAAWRKLNRVHLHLTDDEAWRFEVPAHPELARVGATRGHGLPIGPLCASGPEPYGRAYTDDEIASWVARADELGVVLVPEVDVPGHCHAALTALPWLRDPDDASTASSVQGYPNNVLIPGHPKTMEFLSAVFTTLAERFPSSPVLHIGGDEVPIGAWAGSPMVASYAAARGLAGQREIETSFHREVIAMIRSTTGRDVAMWEEAALAGVEPAGYAVAWSSPGAGRRLAAAGHPVVMSPGQAYYLDMAAGSAWELPGASWAGNVTLADTCAFDPVSLGDPALAGDAVIGVQACIWGEHIDSIETLDALVFPRLDAIAERGWSGTVTGGASSLEQRASQQPRFS